MASLMAVAAANGTFASRNSVCACGELNFPSGRMAALALPSKISRRRVEGERRRRTVAIRASSSGTADENMIPESGQPGPDDGDYKSCVDANMMVLRRRIEGMRMKETFMQVPDEWMDWEKSCYGTYRADVNILVASLQSTLLGMRPGLVLFIISFLLAATPVAFFLFLYALGSQLYTLNSAVLDFLAPGSAIDLQPM
ncbi:unnamed protein product [Calypogeia fissa]